jgi:hypothetical protein
MPTAPYGHGAQPLDDKQLVTAVCKVTQEEMDKQENVAKELTKEFGTAEQALQGLVAYYMKTASIP